MAEPVPVLTSSEDESVDEAATDSDVGEMDATSEYGSGGQQHASDPSEEEGSGGSDKSWEEEEDGDNGEDGEGGEVMRDAFATEDSDALREEGSALFKEKKVKIFFDKFCTNDFKLKNTFSTKRLLMHTRLLQRLVRDAKLVSTVVGRA